MVTIHHKSHPKNSLVKQLKLQNGVSFTKDELYQLRKVVPTATMGIRKYKGNLPCRPAFVHPF